MKLQGRNLSVNMRAADVGLLQSELQRLGFNISGIELKPKVFGETTRQAVLNFQKRYGLPVTGIVDPKTAEQINTALKPNRPEPPQTFKVSGQIRQADRSVFVNGFVKAFDKDLRSEELLATATLDQAGRYQIAYTSAQFGRAEKGRADLIIRVFAATGAPVASSAIIFNAEPEETVDVVIGGEEYRRPSEYEQLVEDLTPLVQGLSFAELTEDDQHQDVAFLSGETGQDPQRIAFLIQAHRLMQKTDVPAEVFYGLFREGLPTELPALLAQSADVRRRALLRGADDNIIPAHFGKEGDKFLERFKGLIVKHAFEKPAGGKGTSLGDLLETTPLKERGGQEEFLNLYVNHTGAIEEFWKGLRQNPRFRTHVDELQFTIQLGVLTQNHLPLVKKLQEMKTGGQIADLKALAKFEVADWKAILAGPSNGGSVGFPAHVPGKDDEEKKANYAKVLTRMVEDAFPTAAITYRLAKDEVAGQEDLLTFLTRNAEFEFGRGPVEAFLAKKPSALDGVTDEAGTVKQLKAMERLFKLTPQYSEIRALAADGVDSAQAVVRMGKSTFAAKYDGALGGTATAKRVYERASQVSATAMHLLAEYGPSFNKISMAVLPFTAVTGGGIPDWKTLFGSLELCACQHCRSVLSPAAYLTDILAFLKNRPSKVSNMSAKDILFQRRPDLGEIELTCENTNTLLLYVDLINEVLENAVSASGFALGLGFQADLDNENLSTPFRDEFKNRGFLLSDRAAITEVEAGQRWHVVDTGWRFPIQKEEGGQLQVSAVPQTSGAPAELAANPEHVNPAAYDVLRQAVYPWNLPLDLWTEETRAYLGHLGVPRYQIMETFLPGKRLAILNTPAVAQEYLGLTSEEAKIVTGITTSQPGAASPGLWNLWGFEAATLSAQNSIPDPADSTRRIAGGNWLDVIRGRVDVVLQQSGLKYKELLDLLDTYCINPIVGGARRIQIVSTDPSNPDTCETDKLRLDGLDEAAAANIVRFVRLWRKLGWTARELDKAITALKPAGLSEDFLQSLTHVQAMRTRFNLPVAKTLAWYGRLDTAAYDDAGVPKPKSLYEELFQNPAVIKLNPGEADPFALNAARTKLQTVGSLTDAKTLAALSAALGLDGADLSLLIEGPDAVVSAGKELNLENLSRLHRTASLAKALKLSIQDFLRLRGLTGVQPFANDGIPVTPADTEATLTFLRKGDAVRGSGLTIAALDYLLRHRFVPAEGMAPTEEAIAAVLEEIRSGLKKIVADTALVPDPLGELTAQKLAVLAWEEALIRKAVDTLGGKRTYEEALDPLPAGIVFPAGIPVSYDSAAKKLKFTGAMTLAQQETLLGLSTDGAYQTAVNQLFDAPRTFVQEQMKTFVTPTYKASLASLPPAMQFPAALAEKTSYDSDARLLNFVGTMTAAEQGTLLGLSTDGAYQTAVNQLFDAPATYVLPEDKKFLAVADADDLFDTAKPAQERYEYVLARLNAYLRRTGSESLVKQTLAERLMLDGAIMNLLLTQLQDWPADPAHRALSVFLDPAFTDTIDKITVARFPQAFKTCILLQKVAMLITRLRLTLGELSWLLQNAGALGWLAFNTLPTDGADPAASFDAWERLLDAVQLRDELPSGKPSFFDILGKALAFSPASGEANNAKKEILEDMADLTRWPLEALESLLGPKNQAANTGLLGFRFPVNPGDPNDYIDERTWRRVMECFATMKRLGATADQCSAWAKPDLTADDARGARQAAKSKYEAPQWLEVARPLRDGLREKQRQTLVSYLVAHPDPAKDQHWEDANGLYAYFLIDVEMSPCFMTSRIKQAIGSVQLFVQRCLMNLEKNVEANAAEDESWKDWKWMKHYRVWEAGRKVFLWPENWIEPELRDDKSPFFKDLENELLQNEVTMDAAEAAFLNYLEKLAAVAQLDICGMYHQVEKDQQRNTAVDVLHVFGRTQNTPHVYYYRRRVNSSYWTAWEKVDLDIEGDHLIPVIWNRRLYLFWPVFTEKQPPQDITMPTEGNPLKASKTSWEIQLAWSEYRNKKWSPKKVSKEKAETQPQVEKQQIFSEVLFANGDLEVSLKYAVTLWTSFGPGGGGSGEQPSRTRSRQEITTTSSHEEPTTTIYELRFSFVGCEDKVDVSSGWAEGSLLLLPGTQQECSSFSHRGVHRGVQTPLTLAEMDSSGHNLNYSPTLDATPGKFRVRPEQFQHFDDHAPMFYSDDTRTFFVMPGDTVRPKRDWPVLDRVRPDMLDYFRDHYYPELATVRDPVRTAARPVERMIYEPSFPVEVGVNAGRGSGHSAVRGETTMDMSIDATNRTGRSSGPGFGRGGNGARVGRPPARTAVDILGRGEIGNSIYLPTHHWVREYRFETFYHPYTCLFLREINRDGIDGLLQRPMQIEPHLFLNPPEAFDFGATYKPKAVVIPPYPREDVDFTYSGAYSLYNWELCFHAPLIIANRLSKNQRFEEAQRWFHYIFDPTDTSGLAVPQRYWRTKPFYETTDAQYQKERIANLLRFLAKRGDPDELAKVTEAQKADLEELEKKVEEWRKNPFRPHVIARMRTTAYQKTVVMKYVDNLIAWGDQLFRRETIESSNEATQLYILAADILGRRPQDIPPRAVSEIQTYNTLEPKLDVFSNALVQIEEFVPPSAGVSTVPTGVQPPLTLPAMLYFCVPKNDKLLGYWDTVADRLFKIRHCMNIEGVVRQLPLFEPPIDPALLVKAAALGVDIASALTDSNAPLPAYRFQVMAQKVAELCSEVKALGSALLSALEKRDAEALALLRSSQEIKVLDAVRQVKEKQIEEVQETLESLKKSKDVITIRRDYYRDIPRMNEWEIGHLVLAGTALGLQTAEAVALTLSGGLHLIPNIKIAAPTSAGGTHGGENVGQSAEKYGASLGRYASVLNSIASMAATMGSYQRRYDEWKLQERLANRELEQIDKQIAAAEIRKAISERELGNHDLQAANAKEVDTFMREKFTNQELYDWMVGQISGLYFQSYQLAYDVAKRAERAFRHELGLGDSSFIQFGYWDSLKKGLLAGERLAYDLRRMEAAYLDQNRREYELTKSVSLALTDPIALVRLRETGECFVSLPEALFDMDHPGHYMRRIKSVSLTIPCVVGPYTGVHCTLTLMRSSVRKNAATAGGYARTSDEDPRFADSLGAVQSIATSSGQNDAGLFEVNFRDERYLPFEGQGAVDSEWRIQLDKDANRFDFNTISDVLIHIRYTAREGGEPLRAAAKAALPQTGVQLFIAKHEFSDAWHRFLNPPAASAADRTISMALTKDRFPFPVQAKTITIDAIELLVKIKPEFANTHNESTMRLSLGAGAAASNNPMSLAPWNGLLRAEKAPAGLPGAWTLTAWLDTGGGAHERLDPNAIQDIFIVCHYTRS